MIGYLVTYIAGVFTMILYGLYLAKKEQKKRQKELMKLLIEIGEEGVN